MKYLVNGHEKVGYVYSQRRGGGRKKKLRKNVFNNGTRGNEIINNENVDFFKRFLKNNTAIFQLLKLKKSFEAEMAEWIVEYLGYFESSLALEGF